MNRLAVGFFDGVHLGHQAILRGATSALTFANHPLTVLAPEKAPPLVMSVEDRIAAIRACGVSDVTVLEFTRDLAALAPEEFMRERLVAGRSEVTVVCGGNWRFGSGGSGDAAFLRAHGVAVEVVPYAEFEGRPVSSSRIRLALSEGDLRAANAMLGRPFAVTGRVVRGKGLGRELGSPTVNLVPAPVPVLPRGVYVVGMNGRTGVANWGLAPTMGARAWRESVLEVHLLGEGKVEEPAAQERVEFRRYLRPERTFPTISELRAQIARDLEEAVRTV